MKRWLGRLLCVSAVALLAARVGVRPLDLSAYVSAVLGGTFVVAFWELFAGVGRWRYPALAAPGFLIARIVLRAVGVWKYAPGQPWGAWAYVAGAVSAILVLSIWGYVELKLERFIGLRYLHRRTGRRSVGLMLAVSGVTMLAGTGVFFAARASNLRGLQTTGLVLLLLGALGVAIFVLLRTFSVFSTVSAMGVVLGVASLVVVLAVTSGFEREFQDKVLALNAHLIVIPYGDVDVDSSDADLVLRRMRELPGVERAAKFLFSAGEVMVGGVGANLKGVDLTQGADDLRHSMLEGTVEDLERPASCPGTPDAGRLVLGAELARRLHAKVGSCVSIMVPFAGPDPGTLPSFSFRVVGTFRMGFNEYDTRLVYTSLHDARRLSSARGSIFGVELRFADPMQALSMAAVVKAKLDSAYRVIDWKDLNHNLFMALTMQKVIISLLLMIIIIVAAFNIISSLKLIVMSKTREIAILKSMGASSRSISRIFLVAGSTVGGVGVLVGILYGLLVCGVARLYGYPLDPKVYLISMLPVRISLLEIAIIAAATMAICFLASFYPALGAAREKPVEGLRHT